MVKEPEPCVRSESVGPDLDPPANEHETERPEREQSEDWLDLAADEDLSEVRQRPSSRRPPQESHDDDPDPQERRDLPIVQH